MSFVSYSYFYFIFSSLCFNVHLLRLHLYRCTILLPSLLFHPPIHEPCVAWPCPVLVRYSPRPLAFLLRTSRHEHLLVAPHCKFVIACVPSFGLSSAVRRSRTSGLQSRSLTVGVGERSRNPQYYQRRRRYAFHFILLQRLENLICGGSNSVPLYKYSNSFLSFHGVYDFIDAIFDWI